MESVPTQPTKQSALLETSYRCGPGLVGRLGLPDLPSTPTQRRLNLTGSSGKPLSCRPWVASAGSCREASAQSSLTLEDPPTPNKQQDFQIGCGSQHSPALLPALEGRKDTRSRAQALHSPCGALGLGGTGG